MQPSCSPLRLTIKLQRRDSIPAFGAYLRCERQHRRSHTILINVEACMAPEHKAGRGLVRMTKRDRIGLVISTLMHEFGHALEAHFGRPVNERAIERACRKWEIEWMKTNTKRLRTDDPPRGGSTQDALVGGDS